MAASSEKLKQVNKQSIKDYFYEVKFSNKNQLAQATGISKTTCTTLISLERFFCRCSMHDPLMNQQEGDQVKDMN